MKEPSEIKTLITLLNKRESLCNIDFSLKKAEIADKRRKIEREQSRLVQQIRKLDEEKHKLELNLEMVANEELNAEGKTLIILKEANSLINAEIEQYIQKVIEDSLKYSKCQLCKGILNSSNKLFKICSSAHSACHKCVSKLSECYKCCEAVGNLTECLFINKQVDLLELYVKLQCFLKEAEENNCEYCARSLSETANTERELIPKELKCFLLNRHCFIRL